MINIKEFISGFDNIFQGLEDMQPWEITSKINDILFEHIKSLDGNYEIKDGIAIHKSAIIENNVTLKAPVIIAENCFIGANAYLRNGVFIGKSSKCGPGCELKSSIIFNNTTIAHFNFVGDSIIGSNVNFEAGAVIANHYNERTEKKISVKHNSELLNTNVEKFGALVGDNSRIGANAVLSPGTILLPDSVVKRLELINQIGRFEDLKIGRFEDWKIRRLED